MGYRPRFLLIIFDLSIAIHPEVDRLTLYEILMMLAVKDAHKEVRIALSCPFHMDRDLICVRL